MADIGKPLRRYKVVPVSPVQIPATPEPSRRAAPTPAAVPGSPVPAEPARQPVTQPSVPVEPERV
jgi:hypothetical protein